MPRVFTSKHAITLNMFVVKSAFVPISVPVISYQAHQWPGWKQMNESKVQKKTFMSIILKARRIPYLNICICIRCASQLNGCFPDSNEAHSNCNVKHKHDFIDLAEKLFQFYDEYRYFYVYVWYYYCHCHKIESYASDWRAHDQNELGKEIIR